MSAVGNPTPGVQCNWWIQTVVHMVLISSYLNSCVVCVQWVGSWLPWSPALSLECFDKGLKSVVIS